MVNIGAMAFIGLALLLFGCATTQPQGTPIEPTCAEQGGNICEADKVCLGGVLSTSEADLCCSIPCGNVTTAVTPPTVNETPEDGEPVEEPEPVTQEIEAINQPLLDCDNRTDRFEKEECYMNVAIAQTDETICGKLQIEDYRLPCYEQLAIAKSKVSLCYGLPVESKERCIRTIAKTSQNVSVCYDTGLSSDLRIACYADIAEVKKDASICYNALSKTEVDLCYANVSMRFNDSSICERIQENSTFIVEANYMIAGGGVSLIPISIKDDCYWDLATANLDPSLCSKIQNITYYPGADGGIGALQETREQCYMLIAYKTQNGNICDNMVTQPYRDQCYGSGMNPQKTPYAEQDASICAKLQTISGPWNTCTMIALAQSNPAICDMLQWQKEKNSCYYVLAPKMKDLSLCDKIDTTTIAYDGKSSCSSNVSLCSYSASPGIKELCYVDVACSTADLSICYTIQEPNRKNTCFSCVGRAKRDLSICDMAGGNRYSCYYDIARDTKDNSICDLILSYSIKEQCYAAVAS